MAIIIIGILLIIASGLGIVSGYSAGDFAIAGFAWAMLIIGTLITLFGIGKRISENRREMRNPNPQSSDQGHAEIRALIQSMGVVAVADNKVRDQEVEAIGRIHEQMLGIHISGDEIREILKEFESGFDINARLTRNRSQISPTMKRVIVQSCHLVMVSDMEIVPPEESKVHEIGRALGFDNTEIDDLIATAGT
ncbi:MAG: TerB family tellurite resistance protein [Pseudomonadota bacterium]